MTKRKTLFSQVARQSDRIALDNYSSPSEVRRLAISAATVKENRRNLPSKAKPRGPQDGSPTLAGHLVRLRRIASNKPDVARLQDFRTASIGFPIASLSPATARKQRDEALAALADATSQIERLNEQWLNARTRSGALLGVAFKTYEKTFRDSVPAYTTIFALSRPSQARGRVRRGYPACRGRMEGSLA